MMGEKPAFFSVVTACLFWVAAAPSSFAAPDCTCRYQGQDVMEGQTACLATPKGMKMAKCEKVLNNTSWKFLEEPCPTAQNAPSTPFDTAQLRGLAEAK